MKVKQLLKRRIAQRNKDEVRIQLLYLDLLFLHEVLLHSDHHFMDGFAPADNCA